MWILSKLRTGYFLNEYLCTIGVVGKPYCKCGEIESCEHYLMECEEVQDLRERLKVATNRKGFVDNGSVPSSDKQR